MSGWITPITSAAGVRPTKTHGQKSTMYGIILTEMEKYTSGWLTYKGNKYYLKSDGTMLANE